MSVYGIEHVIGECLEERLKVSSVSRGQTIGARQEIYWESWNALNLWIESRLAKKLGATLPMLGSFTWQVEEGQYRPLFLISDSFVKEHNIKRPRVHKLPNVAPCEETNFSKLAIKFSNSLTKDMVFCGVRDIIKKIGDFIDRVYEFEIDFSFGILKSKNRRVKFDFNSKRLRKILPENAFADIQSDEKDAMEMYDSLPVSPEASRSKSLSNLKYSTITDNKSFTSLNTDNIYPQTSSRTEIGTPSAESSSRLANNGASNSNSHVIPTLPLNNMPVSTRQPFVSSSYGSGILSSKLSDRPLSPGLEKILEKLELSNSPVNKHEKRRRAMEKVAEQAFHRCIDSVEKLAEEEDQVKVKAYEIQKQMIEKDRLKREKALQDVQNLKETLDHQMHEYQNRSVQDRQTRMSAAVTCILKESNIVNGRVSTRDRSRRQELAKELQSQIQRNHAKKVEDRRTSLDEEREYLDHVAMELDLQYAAERATHLDKQRVLLEAWEKEGHLRNLKKLQSCGASTINAYLDSNMSDQL